MMRKALPQFFGGYEYVQLSKLPQPQAEQLRDWLPLSSYFKIQDGPHYLEDCIHYEEYEQWYDHCYGLEEAFDFFDI